MTACAHAVDVTGKADEIGLTDWAKAPVETIRHVNASAGAAKPSRKSRIPTRNRLSMMLYSRRNPPKRVRYCGTGVIHHIGVFTQIHAAGAAVTKARRHGTWLPDKVNDGTCRFIPVRQLWRETFGTPALRGNHTRLMRNQPRIGTARNQQLVMAARLHYPPAVH